MTENETNETILFELNISEQLNESIENSLRTQASHIEQS